MANASGSVIQRNSYYSFGMSFREESDLEQGLQSFKYNGKELYKTHGNHPNYNEQISKILEGFSEKIRITLQNRLSSLFVSKYKT